MKMSMNMKMNTGKNKSGSEKAGTGKRDVMGRKHLFALTAAVLLSVLIQTASGETAVPGRPVTASNQIPDGSWAL